MIRDFDIECWDIPMSVSCEINEYDNEPYSWGQDRGTETEVIALEVLVGGVDIKDILSNEQIEYIENDVKERLIK